MTATGEARINVPLVVFLGAGASEFAGYCTFFTFRQLIFDPDIRKQEELPSLHETTPLILREIEEDLRLIDRPPTHDNYLLVLNEYKHFCETFKSRQAMTARFSSLWEKFGPFSQIVSHAIDDITRTTLHHYSRNRTRTIKSYSRDLGNSLRRVYAFYLRLAKINSRECPFLPVFTTNYDLLLEDIFFDNEINTALIDLRTGMSVPLSESSYWSHDNYGVKIGAAINLYRLHGCVCWLKNDLEGRRIYYSRQNLLQQDWRQQLCVMLPGREIFPGIPPHSFAFQELHRSLTSCKIVIFIGFSFRDDDIMHILLSANAHRPSENPIFVVVVNPVLNTNQTLRQLAEAAARSVFPVRIPDPGTLQCVNCEFGYDSFDDAICQAIETVLQKKSDG